MDVSNYQYNFSQINFSIKKYTLFFQNENFSLDYKDSIHLFRKLQQY